MAHKIVIENASFSYGEKDIFAGLNLEVPEGDMLCILGANGCGKTTLLRCINGALKLKSGHIRLDGTDIYSMKVTEIARKVGFVYQEHSAPFPYSVLEVVRMGRAPHLRLFSSPSKKDTVIAEEALLAVGMWHLRDKRYTEISGGERQLALIARTLAQEPEVIILDEPTSHLDFRNQTLVLRMIGKLAERGLTIITTSHFPNHALLYSRRVTMMNKGKLLAAGDPDDVINEQNLRTTYGIDVRVLSVADPDNGDKLKFCIPTNEVLDVIGSGLAGIENLLDGEARIKNGIAVIDIGKGTSIQAVTGIQGKVKVYLHSDEIILSKHPLESSGRNLLKGRIAEVSHMGVTVKLEIDVGQRLAVLITKKSFDELGFEKGAEVYATFKASAVQVFKNDEG